jgi:hypothetical protein
MNKFIFKFLNFIYEGYGRQNLYHLTSLYPLQNILDNDEIEVGYYENPYNDETKKFISFTRNKFLNLEQRKFNVILELDTEILKTKYKIIPYDFYVHSKQETKQKWYPKRLKSFEFEEIILDDITELHRYLISINFLGEEEDIYKYWNSLYNYYKKYKPTIKLKNKEYSL